jgi:hypothetical protein
MHLLGGEGLITLGALVFLSATRKDLFSKTNSSIDGNRGILIGGAVISLILAVLSPLASSHPDGLEWVAEQKGFLETAKEALFNIIPDYSMPGISDPNMATIVAGILGVIIVFSVAFGVAQFGKRKPTQDKLRKLLAGIIQLSKQYSSQNTCKGENLFHPCVYCVCKPFTYKRLASFYLLFFTTRITYSNFTSWHPLSL